MSILEALPACFPLPRSIAIGSQQWTVSTSALSMGAGGIVRVTLLLSGPYGRFRRARVALDGDTLLAGGYDAAAVVHAIEAWLPNSDADDVLEIEPRVLAAVAHFAGPADHQV
jgi:hypothetical protein